MAASNSTLKRLLLCDDSKSSFPDRLELPINPIYKNGGALDTTSCAQQANASFVTHVQWF
jgi:hypothetical protein